jgi:hypothetical protein
MAATTRGSLILRADEDLRVFPKAGTNSIAYLTIRDVYLSYNRVILPS